MFHVKHGKEDRGALAPRFIMLYLENGYLNYNEIYNLPVPFIFIIGARGIGKTYGAVDHLYKNNIPFLFLRRTKTQAYTQIDPEVSDIEKPLRQYDAIFNANKVTDTMQSLSIDGNEYFALVTSLSTGSNLRGFNGDRVEAIFFDEFIAQPEEKPIREEASTFFNLVETISRNRELEGRPPVKVICAANSFNLANPIFIKLGLVSIAEKMRIKESEVYIDRERGYCIIQPLHSPISAKKQESALYRLVGDDSDFAGMALRNKYLDDISDTVCSKNLKEYRILVTVGEISIYKHKSQEEYYVSQHKSGTPKQIYTTGSADKKRFNREQHFLWTAFMRRNVYFENYLCQVLFDNAFKL